MISSPVRQLDSSEGRKTTTLAISLGRINVRNDHSGSLHRQPTCDGLADAFGCAGYHEKALRNPYIWVFEGCGHFAAGLKANLGRLERRLGHEKSWDG
jgi:hypothetical protein